MGCLPLRPTAFAPGTPPAHIPRGSIFVSLGGSTFVSLATPGSKNNAAMLVGGLDANGDRFLIGLQQNVGQPTQQILSRAPTSLCMVGEVDLPGFTASYLPELPFHPWNSEMPLNPNVRYCLDKMARHIEAVSHRAPSVGGTVRFVVLRTGMEPSIGRWPLAYSSNE